jgi:hypothetical protein
MLQIKLEGSLPVVDLALMLEEVVELTDDTLPVVKLVVGGEERTVCMSEGIFNELLKVASNPTGGVLVEKGRELGWVLVEKP